MKTGPGMPQIPNGIIGGVGEMGGGQYHISDCKSPMSGPGSPDDDGEHTPYSQDENHPLSPRPDVGSNPTSNISDQMALNAYTNHSNMFQHNTPSSLMSSYTAANLNNNNNSSALDISSNNGVMKVEQSNEHSMLSGLAPTSTDPTKDTSSTRSLDGASGGDGSEGVSPTTSERISTGPHSGGSKQGGVHHYGIATQPTPSPSDHMSPPHSGQTGAATSASNNSIRQHLLRNQMFPSLSSHTLSSSNSLNSSSIGTPNSSASPPNRQPSWSATGTSSSPPLHHPQHTPPTNPMHLPYVGHAGGFFAHADNNMNNQPPHSHHYNLMGQIGTGGEMDRLHDHMNSASMNNDPMAHMRHMYNFPSSRGNHGVGAMLPVASAAPGGGHLSQSESVGGDDSTNKVNFESMLHNGMYPSSNPSHFNPHHGSASAFSQRYSSWYNQTGHPGGLHNNLHHPPE